MMRTPEGQPHYDLWDIIVVLGLLAGIGMLWLL